MAAWSFTSTPGSVGRFQVVITAPSGRSVDVSTFRGVPVQIDSYSFGDPFSDASAVLSFPQISGFDDFTSVDVGVWCRDFANVDIFWLTMGGEGENIDPTTNAPTMGVTARTKLWEGFVASMDFSSRGLTLQCQGALFQLDRYLAKPMFPPRPHPHEALIAEAFNPDARPHLRTTHLRVNWPAGWTKKVPTYNPADLTSVLVPIAKPGSNYTGYATRQTGNWTRALTEFVQDLLAVMFTDDTCGVTPGNQWTVLKEAPRRPVLTVRDRFRPPDFSLWYGAVGVDASLSHDTTQMANVIFGEGTDVAGTTWRGAVISSDGSRTDYAPLVHTRTVWPYARNPLLDRRDFALETIYRYGNGFDADSAAVSAGKSLSRDSDAGWSGTLTLQADPEEMSRWMIRAGMTLRLKGFAGSGERGLTFHVAEVTCSPMSGTVQLTIDDRYRDLLTVEEARARNRDALTPSRMLQLNRRSALLEDEMAPWDYTAGSGFIPRASTNLHRQRAVGENYPWTDLLKRFPPLAYGQYYVKVNADKATRRERWSAAVPILSAQSGTIRRVEIVACDIEGNILPVPFHFSLYKVWVHPGEMPADGAGPSPFITGAFESTQANGAPWPLGHFLAPPPSLIVGWGNYAQPAGHSPGLASQGYPPTGLLVDEGGFSFDNASGENGMWAPHAPPGASQKESAYTLYGMFYAEWEVPIYMVGRLYRLEPGTG